MINNKNKIDQERQAAKTMHELFDTMLLNALQGSDSQEIFNNLLKNNSSQALSLIEKRMPKVQNSSADVEQNYLSMKDMLLHLPEFEDVAKALKKAEKDRNQYFSDTKTADEDRDLWRKKYLKLKKNGNNN